MPPFIENDDDEFDEEFVSEFLETERINVPQGSINSIRNSLDALQNLVSVPPVPQVESQLETLLFPNIDSFNAEESELLRNGTVLGLEADEMGVITVTYRRGITRITRLHLPPTYNAIGSWAPTDTSLSTTNSVDMQTRERLIVATNKIESAARNRTHQMNQMRGRREGQYIKMLRSDKRRNMTFIEIVGSEVPIRLASFGWAKVRQILDTIHMSEVESKDGNYVMLCAYRGCKLQQIPFDHAYFCNNHLYCSEHVPDLKMCIICIELYATTRSVKTYDNKTVDVCDTCNDRFTTRGCRNCGERTTIEYIQTGFCKRCFDRNNNSSPYRSFSKNLKWVSDDMGSIVRSKRLYSCEIEALSPFIDHPGQLRKTLPQEVGIASDGSVTANDGTAYGYELQTPRVAGKRGEELIQRMCASTKTIESQVNESCGMHVHIDGKGLIPSDRKDYPAVMINLWKAYLVFEDVLMSLVPYSRRNNDFCRRLSEAFQINELDTIENMVDVEKMWYKARTSVDIRQAKNQHYSATRYFSVNFHCLLNDGHYEIRFHPGTLLSIKILEWANLHVLIADAATNLAFSPEFLREAQATYHLQEKAAMFFDRIGMSKASQQYFVGRQRKFADKKSREDETKNNGNNHRGNSLTQEEN